jgi:hypothetical protein
VRCQGADTPFKTEYVPVPRLLSHKVCIVWPPRQLPSAASEGQPECSHLLGVANQQEVTASRCVNLPNERLLQILQFGANGSSTLQKH